MEAEGVISAEKRRMQGVQDHLPKVPINNGITCKVQLGNGKSRKVYDDIKNGAPWRIRTSSHETKLDDLENLRSFFPTWKGT